MAVGRDAPHWKAYERIKQDHPDLLDDLEDRISDFAATRDEFTSKEAGEAILRRWPRCGEWNSELGSNSRGAFGLVLLDTLRDDFNVDNETQDGRPVKVYRRKRRHS